MKKLGRGAVGTGSGTLIYTVPVGYRCDVKDIVISNTTSSSITLHLHLVPSGALASTDNAMFYGVSLPGNTTVAWSGTQSLNSGDFIQAIGSSTGLTLNVSGEESRVSL